MGGRWFVAMTVAGAVYSAAAETFADALPLHVDVEGVDVTTGDLRTADGPWRPVAWDDLEATPLEPGAYEVRFRAEAGPEGGAVSVPSCAGRRSVIVDGRPLLSASPGPIVVPTGPGAHEIVIALSVSPYERRVACGERPKAGAPVRTIEGLGVFPFSSPYAARGGGRAVVYVPPHHDLREPSPLLVGLHPWNGSTWTYAGYASLFRAARARDVPLLLPSALGNSLYTADAENEVMLAIDAVSSAFAVDSRGISVWGASMGGAGATTIAFHRPDRFAGVTSFFGDSKYDWNTYVRFVLPNEAAAHFLSALDAVDNARWLPVWLVHGEEDRTSPLRQSALLASAMQDRGFAVRFDRVPGAGHEGALVARFLPGVVETAASARVPVGVRRVTYRSVRQRDTGAYGVHFERSSSKGDAFVDIERRDDAIHVLGADGVRAIVLAPGALGTSAEVPPPIVIDAPKGVIARWDTRR